MIVVIDYGMGNLRSVYRKIERMGIKSVISSDPKVIASASKLILPGVGHFGEAMKNLEKSGLIPILNQKVLKDKTPILGICLGMQLLTSFSEEGNVKGLDWIKAQTKRFQLDDQNLKIPHMGWNSVKFKQKIPIFDNIKDNSDFYFIHSYRVIPDRKEDIAGVTDYGEDFVSIIARDNIIGVQFHPEKSRMAGVQMLRNFAEVDYA